MSIVEKAVEKLKALQPEQRVLPRVETASPEPATTIERLQERTHHVHPAAETVERVHEPVDHVDRAAETAPSFWPVDRMELERKGLLPAGDEASGRLADELRRIKRPLLDNAIGRGAKSPAHAKRIVVTSAAPGEGKTFTALNLALSLAREPDFEVLLVDGDIPKADITRAFGLWGQPGFMDVLSDTRLEPADVIVRTDVPNLLVAPVGQRHPLTAELFGSLRMEYVLEGFGARNPRRLVVFDSSPLLATPEAPALASHMGQVVVVVAAGRTRRQAVQSALQCLDDSQYVGLILNMSNLPASENHYDGYYGHYARTPEGVV